jgi:hypothetical protein
MTLDLGGTRVELYYTGRNHSDNSIVLVYPHGALPTQPTSYQCARWCFAPWLIPIPKSGLTPWPGSKGIWTLTTSYRVTAFQGLIRIWGSR